MKKYLPLFAVLSCLAGNASPSFAQDAAARAAAIADQQAAEEMYKRLNAAVEDLLAAQAAQQKRVTALAEEVRGLRAESARGDSRYVTREEMRRFEEDLRGLAKSLQEIDQKREADNRLIREELQRLAKVLAAPSVAPRPPVTAPAASSGEFFEHIVQPGETLSSIIEAYNKALQEKGTKGRISLPAVLEANPKLVPERMPVGLKVKLPVPR